MDGIKHLFPPKILEVIDRAGINSLKQLITLSCWDIKKVTNLSNDDIKLLKNIIAEHKCPKILTGYELHKLGSCLRITSGCREIDTILNGGFNTGAITEIYGESGSGKTQIGLQAVAHNWPLHTVYICTEDMFPVKRFEEIKIGIPNYSPDVDYGSTTFVEHITESKDLLSCVRVRLPRLLAQKKFAIIVLDSVAAPFRVENANYIQRAEEMRELAICLLSLAQTFNLAVLCINQVTAVFDGITDVLPSLGLAWSNMVSTRLFLRKTPKTVIVKNNISKTENSTHIRQISVVFAPNLPKSMAEFVITSEGLC